jgi:hypothetical protein
MAVRARCFLVESVAIAVCFHLTPVAFGETLDLGILDWTMASLSLSHEGIVSRSSCRMVELGGGVVCFYHVVIGESRVVRWGLDDGCGVMDSHWVEVLCGAMVALMAGLPGAMRSSTLKMNRWFHGGDSF